MGERAKPTQAAQESYQANEGLFPIGENVSLTPSELVESGKKIASWIQSLRIYSESGTPGTEIPQFFLEGINALHAIGFTTKLDKPYTLDELRAKHSFKSDLAQLPSKHHIHLTRLDPEQLVTPFARHYPVDVSVVQKLSAPWAGAVLFIEEGFSLLGTSERYSAHKHLAHEDAHAFYRTIFPIETNNTNDPVEEKIRATLVDMLFEEEVVTVYANKIQRKLKTNKQTRLNETQRRSNYLKNYYDNLYEHFFLPESEREHLFDNLLSIGIAEDYAVISNLVQNYFQEFYNLGIDLDETLILARLMGPNLIEHYHELLPNYLSETDLKAYYATESPDLIPMLTEFTVQPPSNPYIEKKVVHLLQSEDNHTFNLVQTPKNFADLIDIYKMAVTGNYENSIIVRLLRDYIGNALEWRFQTDPMWAFEEFIQVEQILASVDADILRELQIDGMALYRIAQDGLQMDEEMNIRPTPSQRKLKKYIQQ